MIVSSYEVFGSGTAGAHYVFPAESRRRILCILAAHWGERQDDGHNGFVGTKSLPDSLFEGTGLRTKLWASPPAASFDGFVGTGDMVEADGFSVRLRVKWQDWVKAQPWYVAP